VGNAVGEPASKYSKVPSSGITLFPQKNLGIHVFPGIATGEVEFFFKLLFDSILCQQYFCQNLSELVDVCQCCSILHRFWGHSVVNGSRKDEASERFLPTTLEGKVLQSVMCTCPSVFTPALELTDI